MIVLEVILVYCILICIGSIVSKISYKFLHNEFIFLGIMVSFLWGILRL